MKTKVYLVVLSLAFPFFVKAQKSCTSFNYYQQQLQTDASFEINQAEIEAYTRQYLAQQITARGSGSIIKIPVVFHILYHYPSENISDAKIHSQVEALNKCFRKTNADTSQIPSYFKSLAADCEIEFQLAISDPRKRNTSGIVRKYTPIEEWRDDDKMKFSSEMGDDAWDTKSYLNIWVCNLRRLAGYASMPGGDVAKDGVVLDFDVIGVGGPTTYNMGKTGVHEVGHWLNLKHLWGDEYCGDDNVSDTPKQGGYNSGCPTGKHITCENGPNGDMYMNYMDFTDDACMHLFTTGQKMRMRSLFAAGGARHQLLSSTGLSQPLIFETPLPDEAPAWLHAQLFPNPATNEITIDLSYDTRWIGEVLTITSLQGQTVMQVVVTSKKQTINIQSLRSGMYILSSKKWKRDFILQKFVKIN